MAILYYSGFGSGGTVAPTDVGRGDSTNAFSDSANKMTYVTSPVYSGKYALRINGTSNSTDSYVVQRATASNHQADQTLGSTVYTFIRFRVATLPTADEVFYKMARSGGNNDQILVLNTSGKVECWSGDNATTTLELTSTTTLSTDTWYAIQLKTIANGACELKIDGNSEGTWTDGSTAVFEDSVVGISSGESGAPTQDWFYDLVACRDDDWWADDIRMLGLYPNNGTPTNSAWTGDYTAIDDNPCDEDTTYCNTSNQTDKESVMFDDATGTIAAGDTILAAFARWVGRKISAPTTNFTASVFSGGTEYEDITSAEHWINSYGGNNNTEIERLYETDPNGGGAWTLSRLDGMEIGLKHDQSQSREVRWTTARVDVLYSVEAGTSVQHRASKIEQGEVAGLHPIEQGSI